MPNSRRTAMTLLLAAVACATPLRAATQDTKDDGAREATTKHKVRTSLQTNALAARAAGQREPTFHIAGPSRYAMSGFRSVSPAGASAARGYTEAELREIRAAQIRLVRNLTAGPYADPRGVVLSHPTLGRIVVSNTGVSPTDPKAPRTRISLPNPGLLFGPSAVAGGPSTEPHAGGEPGDPGSGGGDPGGFPVLVPGRGFAGPTAQPPAVGNQHLRGYDAKAIARWDVVPYQDFDGLFHIGVVAFHMNGIDRVEFSVDGGPWTPVTEMKLNPRTDVWEYTATLDASKFADGLVEVRARVFPRNAGEVRVLGGAIHRNGIESGYPHDGEHSIFLKANARESLPNAERWVCWATGDNENDGTRANPFKTIHSAALSLQHDMDGDAGGGTIYLLPGEHPWVGWSATEQDRNPGIITADRAWLTITRDPTTDRGDVVIGSLDGSGPASLGDSQGLRAHLVRISEVTLSTNANTAAMRSYHTNPTLWLDDCHITFPEEFDAIASRQSDASTTIAGQTSWLGGVYATDSEIDKVRDAAIGWAFCRNVSISDVIADAFREQTFNVNCSVSRIGMHRAPEHSDVIQWYITREGWDNVIVYGLEAVEDIYSQAFFGRQYDNYMPMSNAAFVNILLAPQHHFGQWQLGGTHQLFWNFSHIGSDDADSRFLFRNDTSGSTTRWEHLQVRNSVFHGVEWWNSQDPEGADIHFVNNHFAKGRVFGEEATTGDPVFLDPLRSNFTPGPGSPLLGRSQSLLVPGDLRNKQLVAPASLGPLQPSAGSASGS